ncbi:MAG: glycosyltransferase family 2 protein [Acidimicrobiales bacterium]
MPDPALNEPAVANGSPGIPSVSVVMATYNRALLLPISVEAVLKDPSVSQVLVVVDGSTDGSMELLESMAAADARLMPRFVSSVGQYAAIAGVLDEVTSDVVLLIDDDVVADPGLVAGHARHHVTDQLVVLGYMPVSPLPAEAQSRVTSTQSRVTSRLYAAEYEAHCRRYETKPETILTGLWGGNLSLRTADLRRVGLDATTFPAQLYHTDTDLGVRCSKAGLVGVFDRALSARHLHSRSIEGFLRDARSRGAAMHWLHGLYPDLFPSPGFIAQASIGRAGAAQLALGLASRPAIADRLTAAAVAGARLSATLGQRSCEEAAIRLARRMQHLAGASEAAMGKQSRR